MWGFSLYSDEVSHHSGLSHMVDTAGEFTYDGLGFVSLTLPEGRVRLTSGTDVLRNKLNIMDAGNLEQAMYDIADARSL
jgi:hypothetical protein